MEQGKSMAVFAHESDPETLPIWQVRNLCNQIAEREIDQGTFSRWCGRFAVSGEAIAEIPLEIASSLATFAMLHLVEARKLDGRAYKRLYPMIHRRMKEVYGQPNRETEWRYADPAAQAAGAE